MYIEFMFSFLMEVGDPRYQSRDALFELLYIVAGTVKDGLQLR